MASVTSSLSQEEKSNMGDAPDADRGLTDRVLKSYSSIEEPRLRSLVLALIRHLHAYVGETKLTDQEWEFAWNFMGRMAAVPDRNEFLLAGDVLGVSQLIETLNHDRPGQSVGFALVGPFLRADAPFRKRGDSIASDDTPGARVRVSGKVFDVENDQPLAGAILDVWQAATNGLYENQDPNQPDYNLRGRFKTDDDGSYQFVALMPTAYPVPTDGPMGELLVSGAAIRRRPSTLVIRLPAPKRHTPQRSVEATAALCWRLEARERVSQSVDPGSAGGANGGRLHSVEC